MSALATSPRTRSPLRSRSPRRSGQWDPSYLGLRALYDNRASFAGGMADRSGNGLADATVGAGSNSPLWLPYTRPSVHVPSSNTLRTPDSAQLRWVSGNIQLTTTFTPLASAVGSDTYLIIKGSAYVSREYSLLLRTTGVLSWFGRDSGGGSVDTNSAAAVTLTPGVPITLRLTVNPTTGVRTFEQSTDGVTFTGVGAPVAGAPFTPIASTGDLNAAYSGDPGSIRLHRASVALNGVTVADFNAEQCTQTGCTDAFGNPWAISRLTAGRKAVVQSPAARSANGVWLFGTDDYIDVPAAAIPALDTFAAHSSVIAVYRVWHNPGTSGHAIFATKASFSNATLGFTMRLPTAAGFSDLTVAVGDGAATDTFATLGAGVSVPFGARSAQYAAIGSSSPFVLTSGNGGTQGVDTGRSTTATTSTGGAGRIGAYLGGTGFIDMEFEALLTADRALTASELAQIVAFYQGGM